MYLKNIHLGLEPPKDVVVDSIHLVKGDYLYYHYGCDGFDDRGWGCGYRTLQTLCSWCRYQQLAHPQHDGSQVADVPSLRLVQQLLVSMGDKPEGFVDSREWIGSVEVGLIVDQLYNVPCKIVHFSSGLDLCDRISVLEEHFLKTGSPIMIGGDSDSSSKCLLGTCQAADGKYMLILDPHYYGPDPDQKALIESSMLLWRRVDSFMVDSFYNMCLPQYTDVVS